MNLACYVANFLKEKGVTHIFGYPGRASLKLIHEISATEGLTYIQNYHEQACAFAADAYARVTNNIGVAVSTSGPGATNLITGIANAQYDSIPTLFITGQDNLSHVTSTNGARQNGFQDVDIVNIVKSITKYSKLINSAHEIQVELEKAFSIATTGRPGAVLLDIPIDIQFQNIGNLDFNKKYFHPTKNVSEESIVEKVKSLANDIRKSKRPLVLVGGGVRTSNAVKEFRGFINATNLQVVGTLNGLDVVESVIGLGGLNGTTVANLAINNADLLVVFGSKFGLQHVGKNSNQYTNSKIWHIDIDAMELGRVFKKSDQIKSDIKSVLIELEKDFIKDPIPLKSEWRGCVESWLEKYANNTRVNGRGLDPITYCDYLFKVIPNGSIIVNDVGQHQLWVSQAFKSNGSLRILNSCGHGSMGYSLPASIGALFADPSACVISCNGDGGFQMNMQELMLISSKNLNIKIIVFNNQTLGMIREIQDAHYNEVHIGTNSLEYSCVDLQKLSSAYGIPYLKIESERDFEWSSKLLLSKGPSLIEVALPPDTKLLNKFAELDIYDREKI